jgi:hypothetical protein
MSARLSACLIVLGCGIAQADTYSVTGIQLSQNLSLSQPAGATKVLTPSGSFEGDSDVARNIEVRSDGSVYLESSNQAAWLGQLSNRSGSLDGVTLGQVGVIHLIAPGQWYQVSTASPDPSSHASADASPNSSSISSGQSCQDLVASQLEKIDGYELDFNQNLGSIDFTVVTDQAPQTQTAPCASDD